jgi:DNA-binding transcriptional regulator YdaS (Cro superfamily)
MNQGITQAIQSLGGVARLADALGVSPQVVINWRRRGAPAEHCPAIERATKGEVRCEDLRPDVAWDVLREQGAHE